MEKTTKEYILSVIDEVMEEGDFTYREVGNKLGVCTERVRQLFKKHDLPDFKTLRESLAIKQLEKMIASGEVNQYSLQQLQVKLHFRVPKETISTMVKQNGLSFKPKKSKFLKIVQEIESDGFLLKDHTAREIYDHLVSKGITEFNLMNVSNELSRYNFEFKRRIQRKKTKYDNDFIKMINEQDIDWANTSIKRLHSVLLYNGLTTGTYSSFYSRLKRYGFVN